MPTSLDRTHILIPVGHPHVRDALAVYVRGTAGSVFHRCLATGAVHKLRRAAYHQGDARALGLSRWKPPAHQDSPW